MKELVGHYEAAEILGWKKQQVSVYMQRGKFPEPLQKLASGPIWFKEDIQKFKESRVKMKKYLGTLMANGSNFDELWSDNLEEIKEWAKGRGTYHDVFTDKHYKYKVDIMINIDGTLEPFEEYTEE